MQTPTEKAKSLYETYYSNLTDVLNNAEAHEFAITCSLLCLDEAIASLRTWENTYMGREQILYFLKVKDKLETF